GMWRWRCCGSVVRTEMARGHLASPAPLSGRVGRGEMNAASGNGFAILPTQFCSRDPSPTRLSPLLPNPAFLFCILHRGELPHPAFISPLCIPSPHHSALVCETCSSCFETARIGLSRMSESDRMQASPEHGYNDACRHHERRL